MRSLPLKAKIYLIFICVTGLATAVCAVFTPLPRAHAQRWELALFLVLGVLTFGKKIALMRHKGNSDVGSLSLGFAITFAAMLRLGPSGALVVACVGCLSSCLYPKRQALHQIFFNVASAALQSWFTGLVFVVLNGDTLALRPLSTFPAVAAASLTYFAINTGTVAIVIGLCTAQNVVKLWRQTFLWMSPSYFAGACISTLAMLLCGHNAGAILLFVSPVAYLTYQSYAIYIGRAEEKQQHIERLADLYLATIKSLALAIDAKDQYTHQHILRVQRYAVATAVQMGLDGNDLEGLTTGALLHDIGKLGVPEYVLLKPGRLTDEEFAKIKKHPEIGAAILDPVEFPWPVLPVVKYHHEKWDGTGYPEGLRGEDIPLTARILAVADVYDALTSNRSYRNAWTHEKALEEIKRLVGTQFDGMVVENFLQVIEGVVAELAAEALSQEEDSLTPAASTPKAAEAARDIQRASSELWALYEVAQTLSSSLGLQETLEILARKLEALLPGTACLFLLREDGEEALKVRAAVGVNREFFVGARTLNLESRSLVVAGQVETYSGEYDMDDLLVIGSPTSQWEPLQTALIVPIVHQGEVLGTINLYHPQTNAFSFHDRQLLETIAERAAMALFNGLLFDRTRSHAMTDSLTGLYNLRYLTQWVDERCRDAGRQTEALALLCLDLDSFKPINDNFGHQRGDDVLRDLAALFRAAVREEDIVARYGGDEFLIVLDNAGPAEAEAMVQRLQDAVQSYEPGLFHERLGTLQLGVSIGYGCFPHDGQDCATLISAADSQMYLDKTERKLGKLASKNRNLPAETDDPALNISLAA